MPKAKSLTGRTEVVRRWKIYADGRVEDPSGHLYDELPAMIAFSAPCVELAKQGKLEVEGIKSDVGNGLEKTPSNPILAPADTSDGMEPAVDEKPEVEVRRKIRR